MEKQSIPKYVDDPFYRYKREILKVEIIQKCGGQTVFVNLEDVCKQINRPIKLVVLYLKRKLKKNIHLDKKLGKYKMNGKTDVNELEEYLEKFILKYVLCKTCKNPETNLEGQCKACGN